jgi:membrane protein required for colicin V production
MNVNYFDAVLLAILVLFLLRGAMNGLLNEISGLFGLFGGLWYAHHAYGDLAPYLGFVRSPVWRDSAAYAVVFASVVVAAALLVHLLSKVLSLSVLPSPDKALGAVLGLVRGLAICSVSLVLLNRFLPDVHFFRESVVIPHLRFFIDFAAAYLPASLR